MLNDLLKTVDTIYIAYGITDFRQHIDSLTTIVKNKFKLNPYSKSCFIFCNKSKTSIRCLCYDKNRVYNGREKVIEKRKTQVSVAKK